MTNINCSIIETTDPETFLITDEVLFLNGKRQLLPSAEFVRPTDFYLSSIAKELVPGMVWETEATAIQIGEEIRFLPPYQNMPGLLPVEEEDRESLIAENPGMTAASFIGKLAGLYYRQYIIGEVVGFGADFLRCKYESETGEVTEDLGIAPVENQKEVASVSWPAGYKQPVIAPFMFATGAKVLIIDKFYSRPMVLGWWGAAPTLTKTVGTFSFYAGDSPVSSPIPCPIPTPNFFASGDLIRYAGKSSILFYDTGRSAGIVGAYDKIAIRYTVNLSADAVPDGWAAMYRILKIFKKPSSSVEEYEYEDWTPLADQAGANEIYRCVPQRYVGGSTRIQVNLSGFKS